MEISEEEIIRRYGARWNIEVYFKTCKQYLTSSQSLLRLMSIELVMPL